MSSRDRKRAQREANTARVTATPTPAPEPDGTAPIEIALDEVLEGAADDLTMCSDWLESNQKDGGRN